MTNAPYLITLMSMEYAEMVTVRTVVLCTRFALALALTFTLSLALTLALASTLDGGCVGGMRCTSVL